MEERLAEIGFIGLGVMGEPMCRNLAGKSGRVVRGFDVREEPLARLAGHGVLATANPNELADHCGVIFLSLPSGELVAEICEGANGLLARMSAGDILVDMSTTPVDLTRRLAERAAERGVHFADAPIARTRVAAEQGSLSITVGADERTYAAINPLLACCGTDLTHCGPVGSGQVVKILNNMVMMETVVALSEALAIANRAGVDGATLFDAFAKGSADSFALRNHGMKAVLPQTFPERAFSAAYAYKDLGYALRLAEAVGVQAEGAHVAGAMLRKSIERGDGELYWPVISRVVASGG
ncbi:6-phosphogluconate dehydrogenase [Novosphingobium endophyticum]|uniref:6-phosphogluconate dehydrogenase n=1 Tax=Novosphingobium endophyticum TaxID=1955250 RepID=A0A916TWL1_9SPHN|nr:NAD(P)-dependent oxidoreductase [Novosphingobium endophyticum]GGC13844.1 6-phosphogluconate dehydrogenase [Novosphingobium endophyticum]